MKKTKTKNRRWRNPFMLLAIIISMIVPSLSMAQVTISTWNYEPLQGTNAAPTPNTGSGTSLLVGSMTGAGTATGINTVSGCGAQVTGQTAWAIGTAAPGATNESSGAQWNVSTVGYENIIFAWEQRWSGSSTNTVRLQYTTNGSTWTNFSMDALNTTFCDGTLNNGRFETNTTADRYRRITVNLSSITAANNNANFGVRVVAAHYQATGQFRQVATPASVATGGTWRFDNVFVRGTALPLPTITPSVTSLTGFNYVVGLGPSSTQSFTFTGANLIGAPGNITVDAGVSAYEVSTDGTNFFQSVTFPFSSATLTAQTVFVRLQASQPAASYNSQVITITGGSASNSITASGTVDPATPQITVGAITPNNIFSTNAPTPSAVKTFTISGTNLTNDLTISAVPGYEYSSNGGFTWNSSLTFNTVNVSATISVRLIGSPAGSYNGTITITSVDANNSPATISVLGDVFLVPTLTEVILPQYMKGNSGSSRLPYIFRATINNLTPNVTYRYFNQCVSSSDGAAVNGAGNPIYMNDATWVHSNATGLSTAGQYGEFITDGSGSYTGWFGVFGTGNARFNTGSDVFMRIMLNDGAGGNTVINRVTTTNSVKAIDLVTSAGVNNGTAIRSISNALAKDYIFLYDNETGTGRPLSGTYFESDAVTNASASSFYASNVDGVNKAWGTIIPNNNANGVRFVASYSRTSGNLLCSYSDNDGVWPTGSINTVNPTGGNSTPIVLSNIDVPMQCFLLPYANISASTLTGTEAASTAITLTVSVVGTIASPQTVDLNVSGLGITAGDYTLSTLTVNIPAGTNPSGNATFTVTNDILFEGLEIATISILNPSSGIELGFSTSLDIDIIDNEIPKIVINEIMYNSTGADEEWIELYNNDLTTITIDSTWSITGTPSSGGPWTRTFPPSTSISFAPGQYVTIRCGSNSAGVAFPFTPTISLSTAADQLSNTGAPLVLRIGTAIIDNVTYSPVTFNPAANGGGPSLSLNNPSLDNSLPANWGACKINGTPGLANFNCDAPTFYSILSGDMNPEVWNTSSAIWSTTPTGTEGLCPTFTSTRNFVIQNGTTVRLNYLTNAPSANNITVNSGGKLWTDVIVSGSEKYIRLFGNVTNNGVIGNGVTYDAIGLSIEGINSTLSGGGSYNIARIRKDLITNPISTVTINANVNLRFAGAAFYNNVAGSSLNLTVNAARNLTLTDPTGDISIDGVDGTGSGDRRGNIIVNGTLTVADKIFALTNNASAATCSMTINSTGRAIVGSIDANITGNGGAVGAFPITINTGGKLIINKILKVFAGDLNSNGGITLKSTATQTALIDGSGAGNVTGDVLVERKIGTLSGYHYLSSPIQNAFVNNTVNGWRDDFTILSSVDGLQFVPGNVYNVLPTVFEYDETNLNPNSAYGFIGATGTTDPITPLKGFACVVPANTTVDVFGVVNNGPINYSVTKLSDGINIIGNPYPSPINWTTFRSHNTNLETTYKAFITTGGYAGAYGEYNSFTGIGTNGVGNIIASSQAFLVTSNTAGTSNIQALNTDRTTDLNPTFFTQPAIVNDVLRLELVKDAAHDEIVIFFTPNLSSDSFDALTDAKKMFPFNTEQSFLYSVAGTDKLAMNGLGDFNIDKVIPLGIKVSTAGLHQIVATDLSSFAPSAMIYLYDAETGVVQNLRNNPTYSVHLNAGDYDGRFFIQFTPAVQLNAIDATCNGNDGQLNLTYNSSSILNVLVQNESDNIIASLNNFNGQHTVNNLLIGNYQITYTHANGYQSVDYVTIAGLTPVNLQANASLTQALVGQNVNFTGISSTGNTSWNFGDGVSTIGNDVNHIYNNAGVYVVTASVSNGLCTKNIEITMDITEATGIENINTPSMQWITSSEQITLKLNEAFTENAIIELYDLSGKLSYSSSISKGQTQHTISTVKFADGIYIAKVLSNDNLMVKKLVVKK
jgi:hypothetical protein